MVQALPQASTRKTSIIIPASGLEELAKVLGEMGKSAGG